MAKKQRRELTEEEQVSLLVKAVSKLPPPPPPRPIELADITSIRCACGYMKDLSVAKLYHTGVVQACEAVCRECEKKFRPMSRLVCCSCRQIVGWIEPGREPCGFTFEPGRSYHLEVCGFCRPDVTEADIIEKVIFLAYKNGDRGLVTNLKWKKQNA